ncbi:hypothetical protein DFH28DRAFT_885612 [Melampsora americana]|nr:hypothetical protein DFH28DRAFT_885612 [Melampsora americana]
MDHSDIDPNSSTTHKTILPAPPETEIFTTNGEQAEMDAYVQAFGAHQYGYNIRKGNSSTGVICHYHCHQGGSPPPRKKGSTRPSRSARIGCKFKLTARPNHQKQSWLLIHCHLGHNHPPNYNIKPRKRKQPTIIQTSADHPQSSTEGTADTIPVKRTPLKRIHLESIPLKTPKATYHHHNTSNIDVVQATMDQLSARLEALSPNSRKYKIDQMKLILEDKPHAPSPLRSLIDCSQAQEAQSFSGDDEHEISIDEMLNEFLVPVSDPESAENLFIQIAKDLIPKDTRIPIPHATNEVTYTTPSLLDNQTQSTSSNGLSEVEAHPAQAKMNDFEHQKLQCEPSSPTSHIVAEPVITRRITRRQARQNALVQTPQIINPHLPALLTKYQVASWLIPFVRDVCEVKSDGHCGFRAISVAIGQPQDDWLKICQAMEATLENYPETFNDTVLPNPRAEALVCLRTHKSNVVHQRQYWLGMPGWSGVIATTFNRPVIYYSKDCSIITFPYLTPPNENPPIVLCFANLHFCTLILDYTLPDLPIPRLCPTWARYKNDEASTWTKQWSSLIGKHTAFVNARNFRSKRARRKCTSRIHIN